MSIKNFNRIQPVRIYEKIVQQMRTMIQDGYLSPGDRLPPERELAKHLGCSRTSLREACRVLESEGVIISKPGGGRYIQQITDELNLSKLYSSIDLLEKTAIFQFIEARETLEAEIAYLAAKRATAENIKNLDRISKQMKCEFSSNAEAITADAHFHVALAEATQNFVYVSMIKLNLNMYRQVRKQTLKIPYRTEEAFAEHTEILEAVKRSDADGAKQAMLAHLQKLKQHVLNGGEELGKNELWSANGD